jgi:hypothetical protein
MLQLNEECTQILNEEPNDEKLYFEIMITILSSLFISLLTKLMVVLILQPLQFGK